MLEEMALDLIDFIVVFAIILLLICVFAFGCAPSYPPSEPSHPACSSECGVYLMNPLPDNWTCDAFFRAERLTVSAFKHHVQEPRFQNACENLRGTYLYVQPVEHWPLLNGESVSGLAYCDLQTLFVGSADPTQGALPHEFAHRVEECKDFYHEKWWTNGIYDALIEVQGFK